MIALELNPIAPHTAAETPSLWPSPHVAFARKQLLKGFSSADPANVYAAIEEAADVVPPGEGSTRLMQAALELLRRRL